MVNQQGTCPRIFSALLISILIMGCADDQRQGSVSFKDDNSNSTNQSDFDSDFLNSGQLDIPNSGLPGESFDLPALPGLNESTAETEGASNVPEDFDFETLARVFEQIYGGIPTFNPSALPPEVQSVMLGWFCKMYPEIRGNIFLLTGATTTYDLVTGYYLDILGRFPDIDGHIHWASRLFNEGPQGVVRGILYSEENLNNQIKAYYQHLLRREPNASELSRWRTFLQKGIGRTNTHHSLEGMAARLVAQENNNEYWRNRARSNNTAFIQRLYKDLLGRIPSSWEIAFWMKDYNSAKNRLETATAFVSSDEYRIKSLTMSFATKLGRIPSPGEYSLFLAVYRSGQHQLGIEEIILTSGEYMARQDPRFNPISRAAACQ